jgi:iron complex transport system permease protein
VTARRKLVRGTVLLLVALVLVSTWALVAGDTPRSRVPVLSLFAEEYAALVKIRAARALLGVLVGAGLAVAGVILQAVLRNPLADPYVLGVSSGAGLGAAGAILGGLVGLGAWTIPGAAFVGAMAAMLLVYRLAHVGKAVPVYTLLLSGVIVNSVASSLLLFLAHTTIAKGQGFQNVLFWLFGSLEILNVEILAAAGVAIGLGMLGAVFFTRDLNVLSIGEEPAAHLGLRVERTKKLLFVLASLVTGAAVATSGIIGFVGLIVPHAVRLIIGPDHRLLLPLSMLAGAVFLVTCDVLARAVFNELPIGIITAFIGGPFFIYLLRRHRRTSAR